MRAFHRKITARLPNESGQTTIMVVLALGLFLLGAVAFGTDIANLWFHRQSTQTAADAACTAGIMDMLYQAESAGSYTWVTNKTTDCNGLSGALPTGIAPCWYAAKNGYNGADVSTGVPSVALSYPTSNSNVTTCTSGFSGTVCANSFLQVNIRDRTRVFFAGLLNGGHTTMDVGAQAVCAVLEVQSPIPILVLDPRNETSVTNNGNFTIDLYGGPSRSIQVNSTSTSAVSINGASGQINLCQGGPNATGSYFGIVGAQSSVQDLDTGGYGTCATGGTTGGYTAPDGPISDPFAMVCAPGQSSDCQTTMDSTAAPGVPGNSEGKFGDGTNVTGPSDGCPSGQTCAHYVPGNYSSGIEVKNGFSVFEPGLYYVTGGMALDANSQVCPGAGGGFGGDGSGGTTFYFADNNSISVAANSGSSGLACSNSAGTQLTANDIKCTGSSTLPANLPGSTVLLDNILLAPCSGYYGDPLGTGDPTGEQRGILFFQNRSQSLPNKNQPQWGGGGAFTLGGSMYFHYCDSSSGVAGDGTSCNTTSGFTDQLGLQGGSCSGTYILGDIVTDQLALGGNPCINMDLSTTAAYYILKASLIQ